MPGPWSEEEIILAMEFFRTCPERMHTDSHTKCIEVAAEINRSPGALDKTIRNIKSVHTGHTGLANASQRVRNLVNQYRNDDPALMQRAVQVRADLNLPPLECGN